MFRTAMLIGLFIAGVGSLPAQSKISFDLKKGEILDILLLTTKNDNEALFENYKKTAFPVAMGLSYQPLPGFGIAEYTQGNHQPGAFLFGKWESLEKRERFLADITKTVPDFHEQRRAIWSQFVLTYYEMPKDISIEIDREKVVVATAYWESNKVDFAKFTQQWLKTAKKSGGVLVLELTNGKSPFGYYYQPDYLVLTQWSDREAFEKFYDKNMKMEHEGVKHVNQFILK